MAGTRDFLVTGAPQDLVAGLSLTVGTTYSLQNVDSVARIFVRIQATAPTAGARGNILAVGEFSYPTADPGDGIWVWTDRPPAALIVNDA